jgi:hypothetical protein
MDEPQKSKHPVRVYSFRCKAIKPPPGTKSRARLPREGDPEPSLVRRYLPHAALLIAVLAAGMAIGRFLLP